MSKGEENIPSGIETTSSQTMEDIKKALFKNTMKGKWNEVLETCRNHPEAHLFKITKTGETTLHMAVFENKEQIVKELIKLIVDQPNGKDALKTQNKRNNTPLHFAASVGNVDMCKLIVEADSSLVSLQNTWGETPSFAAASYGKKEAFLYLHSMGEKDLRHARRSDGNTLLHRTIARDYFVFCFKCKKQPDEENLEVAGYEGSEIAPPNLGFSKGAMDLLGLGPTAVGKIRNAKRKHTWAVQIMNELLYRTSMYEVDFTTGTSPPQGTAPAKDETKPYDFEGNQVKLASENIKQQSDGKGKRKEKKKKKKLFLINPCQNVKKCKKLHGENFLLLVAKHGIIEIVKKILNEFPIAKYNVNENKKNIILLATENRQPHIYRLLLQKPIKIDKLFQRVDKDGNNVVHLATKLRSLQALRGYWGSITNAMGIQVI